MQLNQVLLLIPLLVLGLSRRVDEGDGEQVATALHHSHPWTQGGRNRTIANQSPQSWFLSPGHALLTGEYTAWGKLCSWPLAHTVP